jgi:hypothetical protein
MFLRASTWPERNAHTRVRTVHAGEAGGGGRRQAGEGAGTVHACTWKFKSACGHGARVGDLVRLRVE